MLMPEIILILDNIRSTHNVGSILRTADGFGVKEIYFCGYTPYPYHTNDVRLPHIINKINSQIQKTALGANINFEVFDDIKEAIAKAKALKYYVAALEQNDKSIDISEYKCPKKIAIILGNEVSGIDNGVLELCDTILQIPMLGRKESFNVSISAAIALYSLRYCNNV